MRIRVPGIGVGGAVTEKWTESGVAGGEESARSGAGRLAPDDYLRAWNAAYEGFEVWKERRVHDDPVGGLRVAGIKADRTPVAASHRRHRR